MHLDVGKGRNGVGRRAAAWATALWLLAAAGLGVACVVEGSASWTPASPPAWGLPAEAGSEASEGGRARGGPGLSARAARDDVKVRKGKAHRSKAKWKRKPRRKPSRGSQRQRLALAAGHSLPAPVDRAPRYKLDNRHHDYPALDLSLKRGTPVRAVTSGRVRKVTRWGACGRGVVVRGKDGLTYTYCHGHKLLVRKGQKVPAGRTIMKSGNTGNSSGPHLHLQVASKRGRLLCPQHMLNRWQSGKRIPGWKVARGGCVR